jgi:hypothetical protein
MMLPLNKARLTINIGLQLLDEGLAASSMAHSYEVTLHSVKELLLVDITVQMAQSFVASVIAEPTCLVGVLSHMSILDKP